MRVLGCLVLGLGMVVLWGCEVHNPEGRVAELGRRLGDYEKGHLSREEALRQEAAIEEAFLKLDGLADELDRKGRGVLADSVREELMGLQVRYRAARVARRMRGAGDALGEIGEAAKDFGKAFGEMFQDATQGGRD